MRFGLHGSARNRSEPVERSVRAEALGFDAIFFADSHMNNLDPFQSMTLCALATKNIRLGTAVTNMVFRDPTILANSAASLNEIADGRAILGLGTGDGPVYSLGRTKTRLADFEAGLRTIRDLLHGREIAVPEGKERRSGKVRLRIGKLPLPIYISAEGPKTLRLAGKLCDGVILGTGFDLKVLEWARKQIAAGAEEAGRSLAEIEIMPAGMIAVDPDGDKARRLVRARLANRAHHNFRFTFETVPEAELQGVKRFMEAFDISKPIEERVSPELITDYLVRRFSIAGTPRECIDRVNELEAAGIGRIMLTPPGAIYDAVMETWGREVIQRM
ncbi:MAG TPA: LLM class flavin-dependent oxidoreductase [Candidatus Acidoferrales bacterium]|nr:LLM class flavin-dependent oxidoreductase [Candidatus Acidoferrales bacterium]